MKIKIAKVLDGGFAEAYYKLTNIKGLNARLLFKLRAVSKDIQNNIQEYTELKNKYLQESIVLDEHGKAIEEEITQNGQAIKAYRLQDNKKEYFTQKMNELHEIEIDFPEIRFSELPENNELTAHDLTYLEFIVE